MDSRKIESRPVHRAEICWIVCLAIAAACNSGSAPLSSGETEALKQRMAKIEDMAREIARLGDRVRELEAAAGSGRMTEIRLFDESLRRKLDFEQLEPRWWCVGSGACERSKESCENLRRWLAKDPRLQVGDCAAHRIAFCGGVKGTNCYLHRETCVEVSKGEHYSPCHGTE